jgi:hypothetical protein
MGRRKHSPERQAFEIFAAKRPVNRITSQVAAHQAYDRIKHLLTESEKTALSIAWSHATMCSEGRQEHDNLCNKIRERLWTTGSS